MRHRAKFRADESNRSGDMADFRIFKMAAVHYLELLKIGIFNFRSSSEGQYASSCQISCWSVKAFKRCDRFRFSIWWPSAILDL